MTDIAVDTALEAHQMLCVRCCEDVAPWWPGSGPGTTELQRILGAYCPRCARIANHHLRAELARVIEAIGRLEHPAFGLPHVLVGTNPSRYRAILDAKTRAATILDALDPAGPYLEDL